jgi:hypothetical protein
MRNIPHNECPSKPSKEVWNYDNYITFLDDSFKVKHSLYLGDPCVDDLLGRETMHYLNPDSIYYAYRTFSETAHDFWDYTSNTISIANFSWDGKLNFNHTLNLPVDSGTCRYIYFCRALSNGGVLIGGCEGDFMGFFRKSMLLYYHPTREVNNVNQLRITNYELRVYPNPTNGQLRISLPNPSETSASLSSQGGANTAEDIQIFDVVGRLLQSKIVNLQSEIVLDISHLANGLYFLKTGNRVVKFVKE